MFAVVEDEQHSPRPQIVHQHLNSCPGGLPQVEDGRHGLGEKGGIGDRPQLHEAYAVREILEMIRGELDRQARLAGSAGTTERHQAVPGQEAPDRRHLRFPTDEARDLDGQVVRQPLEGPQRREPRGQVRVHNLEDVLGTPEVLEAVWPQVQQLGTGREVAMHQCPRGFGDQNLTAVSGG